MRVTSQPVLHDAAPQRLVDAPVSTGWVANGIAFADDAAGAAPAQEPVPARPVAGTPARLGGMIDIKV